MQIPIPESVQALLDLLAVGDLDAAIDAGLMDYVPIAEHLQFDAPIREMQQRLRMSWSAKRRYELHQTRKRRTPRHSAHSSSKAFPLPILSIKRACDPLPPSIMDLVSRARAVAQKRKPSSS